MLLLSLVLYLFTANGSVRSLTTSDASSNQSVAHNASTSSHESVSVADWMPSHVAEWLQRIGLQRYVELFTAEHVNGRTLLQLDSTRLKVRVCHNWSGTKLNILVVHTDQFMFHWHLSRVKRKKKERKRIYIAPFIYYVYLKALKHGSHSFTCKYTMPAFPSYMRSPDGATPNWGKRHLIAAYYSSVDPEGMKGWVGLVGWPIADGFPT